MHSPSDLCNRTSGRDVPPMYRGIAEAVETSRVAAVKLMCLECVGYVRADVTNCTAHQCPLHPWRPYQPKTERRPHRLTGVRPPGRAIGAPDVPTHTDAT